MNQNTKKYPQSWLTFQLQLNGLGRRAKKQLSQPLLTDSSLEDYTPQTKIMITKQEQVREFVDVICLINNSKHKSKDFIPGYFP